MKKKIENLETSSSCVLLKISTAVGGPRFLIQSCPASGCASNLFPIWYVLKFRDCFFPATAAAETGREICLLGTWNFPLVWGADLFSYPLFFTTASQLQGPLLRPFSPWRILFWGYPFLWLSSSFPPLWSPGFNSWGSFGFSTWPVHSAPWHYGTATSTPPCCWIPRLCWSFELYSASSALQELLFLLQLPPGISRSPGFSF